jgi:proline iminopeptidase
MRSTSRGRSSPKDHDEDVVRVATDDGVDLWATTSGSGRPAILCHGGPGVWDYLDGLADLLTALLFSVRYDQRGCGRSEGKEGPYTLDRAVIDLDAVRAAAGFVRPILVGHSWGAALSLLYALRNPERTAGVIYIAGTGIEWSRWKTRHVETAQLRLGPAAKRVAELRARASRTAAEEREFLVETWTIDHPEPSVGRLRASAMVDRGFAVNYRCNALLDHEFQSLDSDELAERCRRLAVPFLVVEGALDPRPNEAVDSLVAALPAASRLVLADAGHFPWLDAPAEFAGAVAQWLASVDAPDGHDE